MISMLIIVVLLNLLVRENNVRISMICNYIREKRKGTKNDNFFSARLRRRFG